MNMLNARHRAMASLVRQEIELVQAKVRVRNHEEGVMCSRHKLVTAIVDNCKLVFNADAPVNKADMEEAIREHVLFELHAIGFHTHGVYDDGFVKGVTKDVVADTIAWLTPGKVAKHTPSTRTPRVTKVTACKPKRKPVA